MSLCIKCGKPTLYHHSFCDEHYPQKTATILQLKDVIKEQRKEINRLQNVIRQIKQKVKKDGSN